MATFTFTGTLLQHDGVTPYVDSSITIYAGQTPDLVGLKVYSGGGECVTDANGVFTIQLVTGASLYYAVSSDAKPPVFQPFVFAAGAAGSTVNLASVISSSAGAVVPSVLSDAIAARDAAIAASINDRKALARNPDLLVAGTVTRNANGAATSAPVAWPDGSPGTYTADTLSSAFPGAVDGYHITYGSPVTATYTQPTITRDATGAATAVPAIVVT